MRWNYKTAAVPALALTFLTAWLVLISWLTVTTSMLFLAALFSVLLWLVELIPVDARRRVNLRVLVVASGLLLSGAELYLRYGVNRYASYEEKSAGRSYQSLDRDGRGWLHVLQPNSVYHDRKHEFDFSRPTNSLGLAEREVPAAKSPGEYRIITLGDSFTQGIGAAPEAGWVRVMERALSARHPGLKLTVINAGISGSDPWYEYVLLREKLLEYSPDLGLVAINYSDINDMILRGGQARFRPDGSVEMARRPPAWEWLYGVSFIARHIVHDVLHYNRLLRHRSEVPALERDAGAEIVKAIDAFRRMAHERHFRFVVVVHPHADESHTGAYIGPLEAAVAGIRRMDDVGLVDVLHAWRSSGVVTAKNYQSFFWPLDFHNNANGYAIFGAAVAEGLRGLGLPTP